MTAAEVVREYRRGRRDFRYVDIRGANFSGEHLEGVRFYDAILCGVDFSDCCLTHAQLKAADVSGASLARASLNATDLIAAKFTDADFDGADLTGAALYHASLSRANLTGANLGSADLGDADLTRTRLTNVHLFHTNLCNVDVSAFCEERRLSHGGPSSLDHRTVIRSYRHPRFREFATDCGVPGIFLEYLIDCARACEEDLLRKLMQSTFISYGGPDERFAAKLYEALKARGIVTFFFPRSATVGARIGDEVFRGIQEHDRVLLICSRQSLDREGVINEIQETLDREARDGGAAYLLPITLDDYVFNDWKAKSPEVGERVGRRVIGDFRGTARSKAKFDAAIARVVDALKRKRP